MTTHWETVRRRAMVLATLTSLGMLSLACGGRSRDVRSRGASGDGEEREARHVALSPRVSLRVGFPAFAGETLGVAVAHHTEDYSPDVALAIERANGFELVEIGEGLPCGNAASADGFNVVWLDETTPGAEDMRLARVDLDGTVRGVLEVGSPFSGEGCGIAADGDVTTVVSSAVAAICGLDACRPLTLPECSLFSMPSMVWDGEGFVLARACLDATGSALELRISKLSKAGEPIVSESVISSMASEGLERRVRPALGVHRGRIFLAGFDALLELDPSLRPIAGPIDVSRPRSVVPDSVSYQLVAFDERIVLADVGCSTSLESSSGDGALTLFDDALRPLGLPEAVVADCDFMHLAGSPAGRVALARPAPASTLVESVELPSGERTSPRLVANPAGEPLVRGITCDAEECTLAIHQPGVESTPSFEERIVRVTARGDEVSERDVSGVCRNAACKMLFTRDASTIVLDPSTATLSWVDADGRVLWTKPVPTNAYDATLGDPDRPWAAGFDLERAWHWQLGPAGPDESSFDGPEVADALTRGSPIACNDGIYLLVFERDLYDVFPLEPGGLGARRGSLPGYNRVACAGGHFAAFSEFPSEGAVARLLPDGTHGEAVLEGFIVDWTTSGDSIVLLSQPDDAPSSPLPTVTELVPDGWIRTIRLELPEPGWYGRTTSLMGFGESVVLTPETTYFLWKSETALMLSSFPRRDGPR